MAENRFKQLSKKVNQIVKSQSYLHLYGMEILVFFIRLLFFIIGYFVFSIPGIFYKTAGLLIMSYTSYGIAITGIHETSHNSFVKGKRLNRLLDYIFSDFWAGQSSAWWQHRHIRIHHRFTNMHGKEPKLFYYPFIGRYTYFFLLPYLLMAWLVIGSLRFLWGSWKEFALYCLLLISGIIVQTYLFMLVLPLGWALACVFVLRSLFSPLFLQLAVFNHIGLKNPKRRTSWLLHQSSTTRNIKANWFISGIGGAGFIDCHLEHHLFPSLSNHMLKKIKPLVKAYLKKEGCGYAEESYLGLLRDCMQHYHTMFKA